MCFQCHEHKDVCQLLERKNLSLFVAGILIESGKKLKKKVENLFLIIAF